MIRHLISIKTFLLYPLCLVSSLSYYFWKRWIVPPPVDLFSVSETLILLFGCLNLCFLWIGTHLDPPKELFDQEDTAIPFILSPWPTILLLVPTYKESKDILESTFVAISNLAYPREQLSIVVSDDGARDWLKEWIHSSFPHFHYHCRYSNDHAKAGNLNSIFFHPLFTHLSEFLLILDADMVFHPYAIHRLLRPFYRFQSSQWTLDSSLIFVQGPQQFSNIQGLDWLGQQYLFFYQVVLPAYQGFSLGVPCCGTNVLFHYASLCELGGFQYGSITEDFLTSMYFHSQGKKSGYVSQTIATGLAPYSLFDFFKQRKRWMIGGFQILFHPQFLRRFMSLPLSHQWIYGLSGIQPLLSFCLLVLIMEIFYHFDFFPLFAFWFYTGIYLFGLLFLLRHQSLFTTFISISESLFMIFYNLIFFVMFLYQSIRGQTILFDSSSKEKISHHVYSFLLLCPFLIYLGLGITWFSQHEICEIPFLWFIIINLQFFCPILYYLQTLFYSLHFRT